MLITQVSGAARRAGARPGDTLISVNGNPVSDILDVRYYTYEPKLRLELRAPGGVARFVLLRHETGGDVGLAFESDIPGGGRTCANGCVFCFIDQNPPGCRESLYVKDDDARLSFLQGNYISLTNLAERDIARICRMRISPLGISVHAADPALRVRMLRNGRAGECLSVMRRFAGAGVRMNAQIVLCPGYNDGGALRNTLCELQTLGGALISTSIVPVGLTRHRGGLPVLRPVTREDALAAVEAASRFPNVWCSDEIYLRAELPIPPAEFYSDFPQLENGVGMIALFQEEWDAIVSGSMRGPQAVAFRPELTLAGSPDLRAPSLPAGRRSPSTVATGYAAAPFLTKLLEPFPSVTVVPVENRFFGDSVDVAGLLTGSDLLSGLQGRDLGERVLIPSSTLRRGEDIFLDDMTVSELSEKLGVPVIPVEPDAEALWRGLRG
ncbi:MAG: DUF512 domain-containing protein [Oscillospiraceae bacterium]|jgi:putative radical SAM enzyme (TIGR03279 family)|nr:DUF512 domain-containing protein [Oscillospiraceae bacterium]